MRHHMETIRAEFPTQTVRIGVIADDITGASELAGVGLRHGLRAEIVLRGKPGKVAELICVDTDSRSCEPAEAARRASAAAKLLRQAGVDWIYKKVDSVLRGQIVAELDGIRKTLRRPRALLIPANPSRGRIVSSGRYYVHGKPIHRTEFSRDAEHPRRHAEVLKLLGAESCPWVCVRAVGEPLPKSGIIVGEVTEPGDLAAWARLTDSGLLLAGAAEFFAALLAARGFAAVEGPTGDPATRESERELFVCGTMSKASREFVRAAGREGTPVFSAPRGGAVKRDRGPASAKVTAGRRERTGAAAAFGKYSRVIVRIGLPIVRGRTAAKRLKENLARFAESVLRQTDVTHVYAEGGATAAELARRMGWTRLEVMREVAPGVATIRVPGKRATLLTIKPGSYAWPAEIFSVKRR